jgi:RHS repeat-associated protein
VAVYAVTSAGVKTFNYLLSDHQASVSDLTSSTGTSVVNESFTPFGMRRNPTTWSGAASNSDLTTAAGITRQAYTFQTQLGLWMGINHMNGRMEDAVTGRMLSADPTIPDATNTQSYNRYTYVNNNPVTLLDPTGFTANCPRGCYKTPNGDILRTDTLGALGSDTDMGTEANTIDMDFGWGPGSVLNGYGTGNGLSAGNTDPAPGSDPLILFTQINPASSASRSQDGQPTNPIDMVATELLNSVQQLNTDLQNTLTISNAMSAIDSLDNATNIATMLNSGTAILSQHTEDDPDLVSGSASLGKALDNLGNLLAISQVGGDFLNGQYAQAMNDAIANVIDRGIGAGGAWWTHVPAVGGFAAGASAELGVGQLLAPYVRSTAGSSINAVMSEPMQCASFDFALAFPDVCE